MYLKCSFMQLVGLDSVAFELSATKKTCFPGVLSRVLLLPQVSHQKIWKDVSSVETSLSHLVQPQKLKQMKLYQQ